MAYSQLTGRLNHVTTKETAIKRYRQKKYPSLFVSELTSDWDFLFAQGFY